MAENTATDATLLACRPGLLGVTQHPRPASLVVQSKNRGPRMVLVSYPASMCAAILSDRASGCQISQSDSILSAVLARGIVPRRVTS
jgi:hypothetical protein